MRVCVCVSSEVCACLCVSAVRCVHACLHVYSVRCVCACVWLTVLTPCPLGPRHPWLPGLAWVSCAKLQEWQSQQQSEGKAPEMERGDRTHRGHRREAAVTAHGQRRGPARRRGSKEADGARPCLTRHQLHYSTGSRTEEAPGAGGDLRQEGEGNLAWRQGRPPGSPTSRGRHSCAQPFLGCHWGGGHERKPVPGPDT